MDSPAFTVLISTMAGSRFVQGAIDSARMQLGPNDEVIVFENAVASRNRPRWEFREGVRWVCAARHLPLEASWSHGLMLGTRPWILWVHDDDVLRPGAIEQLRGSLAHQLDAVMAYGDVTAFHNELPTWADLDPTPVVELIPPQRGAASYLFRVHVCTGTVLRREAVEAVLPILPAHGSACDRWLFQNVAAMGMTVHIRQPLIGYRQHGESETSRRLRSLLGRVRWSRSVAKQRAACAKLIASLDIPASVVAEEGRDEPVARLFHVLRSLVRERSPLAQPLANALLERRPELADYAEWRVVEIGLRYGGGAMDAYRMAQRAMNLLLSRG